MQIKINVKICKKQGGFFYDKSIKRIIKKWVRSALCIAGHFNALEGELIFASPKIHNGAINELSVCAKELNNLFAENGFGFNARVIANEDFKNEVLLPVLEVSDRVNDTTELFMRSYQLVEMFEYSNITNSDHSASKTPVENDDYSNYKVGGCRTPISVQMKMHP